MNDGITGGEFVILFLQYEELKNEVHKLRTELSMLVLERDELQLGECKNIEIEMAYLLALGGGLQSKCLRTPNFIKYSESTASNCSLSAVYGRSLA